MHSSSLDHSAITPPLKGTRLVRQHLPLVKASWLYLIISRSSICFDMSSRRICSMIVPVMEMRLTGWYFLGSSILFFLKMDDILFYPVSGDFADLPWLFKYGGDWLGNYIRQFCWDPWMHLIRSQALAYVQIPQMMATNRIFIYSERAFKPLPWGSGAAETWEERLTLKTEEKKNYWVHQLSSCPLSLPVLSYLLGGCIFFIFLMNIPIEAFFILHIHCQIQLQLCPSSSHPIPIHLCSIPILRVYWG